MDGNQMNRFIQLIVMGGFLGVLIACSVGRSAPENIFIAYEADSGRSITMHVGDALQITLDENQSTGYLWSIVTNDDAVLPQSEEPAYRVESDSEGAGGQKTYMFEAVAPGMSKLRIVNSLVRETAVIPNRVFELTVEVVD